VWPAAFNAFEIAAPMPREPPVTSATRAMVLPPLVVVRSSVVNGQCAPLTNDD
jgi:hypothetical protein